MPNAFAQFFQSAEPARDNYLSRLFAFFAEDIVRAWCSCPLASYEDLGRPTLLVQGETRGHTLDFTLRKRVAGVPLVAELKCELAYERCRYLTLADPSQLLHHHGKPAFAKRLLSDEPSRPYQNSPVFSAGL